MDPHQEIIRSAYDAEATNSRYVERLDTLWQEIGDTPVKTVRRLLRRLTVQSPASPALILDLGCGTGRDLGWFRQHLGFPAELRGCELSPRMAAIAQQRGCAVEVIDMHTFLEQVAASHPQAAMLVWCNYSIIHDSRESLERLLALATRNLAPGGVFGIGFKAGDGSHHLDPAEGANKQSRPTTYFRLTDVENTINAIGLSTVARILLPASDVPISHQYCWLLAIKP